MTRPADVIGLSPQDFEARWIEKLDVPLKGLDADARRYLHYARYNYARSERVKAHYEMSDELRTALGELTEPQVWIVLTEDWCGDSAYSLPVIMAAAAESELITLRILPRDEHLDVMDRYLTNGSRSVPKLIAFAEDGAELFQWGPRPAELIALREQLLADGIAPKEVGAAGIAWYEEGGWQRVDEELSALIMQLQGVA